jgi:hypothetical protein
MKFFAGMQGRPGPVLAVRWGLLKRSQKEKKGKKKRTLSVSKIEGGK